MQIEHGNAILEIDLRSQEEEFPGEYSVEFTPREYIALQKACPFDVDDDTLTGVTERAEEDQDDPVTTTIADDFIRFLEAAGIEGGTFHLTFYGVAYWLFHDITHADNDCNGGTIYVDARSEHRALVGGAKLARQHGIGLGTIFRALSSAEEGYRERFQCETSALEDFADWLDKEHAPQYT